MNVIPIVFCFDNNLVDPACICISSLLQNACSDTFYDIFILHSENIVLNRAPLDKMQAYYANFRITYRIVDKTFDRAFEIRGITTAAYYRLLIPDIIPEYETIIYSDVDVVFRSDLSAIYQNIDMQDYYLAGVNSLAHFQPDLIRYYNRLNLDPTGIIYSGNLIFNSKKLREDGKVRYFKEYARNKYTFQDMDVLNIVCQGRIKYLPPCFCLTTYISEYNIYRNSELLKVWSQDEINEAISSGIVHYNGKKPWKDICINFDIWWEYYRKSPFYNPRFYFDFFCHQLNAIDKLSFWQRVKILLRYFYTRV